MDVVPRFERYSSSRYLLLGLGKGEVVHIVLVGFDLVTLDRDRYRIERNFALAVLSSVDPLKPVFVVPFRVVFPVVAGPALPAHERCAYKEFGA